jgi:hypothetical protein
MQAEATPGRFTVAAPIAAGTGPLLRPIESGYRGANYDFIQVTTIQELGGQPKIEYALDTRRARTEVRAQVTQARLIHNLVREASSGQSLDPQIGRTLYKLLVPVELEAFLTSAGESQIVLDEGTAGIPWEMLDDDDGTRSEEAPWAIRSKLLRKFKTEKFRQQVKDVDNRAPILVIGEPACPEEYPPLPGAYREAKAVFDCLSAAVPKVATRVEKVMADSENGETLPNGCERGARENWRVIHVAGHGALPKAKVPAVSCSPKGRFSVRRRSGRCGSHPSSCSSIAVTSAPSPPTFCRTIASGLPPGWPEASSSSASAASLPPAGRWTTRRRAISRRHSTRRCCGRSGSSTR